MPKFGPLNSTENQSHTCNQAGFANTINESRMQFELFSPSQLIFIETLFTTTNAFSGKARAET